jgi:acyl-CoA reductase-like NAD-dependent aldehyde dehydrogenase
MKLKSINPSNNEVLGEVEVSTQQEIEAKVKQARQALPGWRDLGIEGRNLILRNFYDLIEKNKQVLAELQSNEMGMIITESLSDIDGNLEYLRWYSDHAAACLAPVVTFETDQETRSSGSHYSLELPPRQLRLAMWSESGSRECRYFKAFRRSTFV